MNVKEKRNCSFDAVVDLDITSPLRRLEDIEKLIAEYNSNSNYDLVFSVVPSRRNPYFNMVQENGKGFYEKVCKSNYTARQQAPAIYDVNGSIYAYRPAFLESEITKTILDYNCGVTVMPEYFVVDIDSEHDLEVLEYLYPHFLETHSELKRIYDVASSF